MKASVVERFNRTLKKDMWKKLTLNGNYKWVDLLPDLVSNYNSRKHRTIGVRPVDVTLAVAEKLLNMVYSSIKIAGRAKFKVEVYCETSIAGAFYEHELHRATHPNVYLVEKVLRDKVYVKWLGFDGSHNSWIHKDNVI
ncbi:uncharacterized protein LOC118646760 [Monomorium pharaonis]|uniref:uncharacterized protein LOC118646760 n=1 Tax=Monomorium pharaonis TaxID=307658 RepID=UPI0017465452|nr:uncharacterized protein LOC118646760 [Monomorium pharaonis]